MSERVCVVTGATGVGGTGRATVRHFSAEGWRVVVNYSHNEKEAQLTADECARLGAAEVLVVRADITQDADCAALANKVSQAWGRCDVLVNNAATTKVVPHRDFANLSGDDFRNILNLNVVGAYLATRAFAGLLQQTASASVVNISSMGALNGTGACMAYGASKAALNTMTLSLARALGPVVRVNALLPGFITGDWLISRQGPERYEKFKQDYTARSILDSVLDPEDVAQAVWWLVHGPMKMTGELVQLDSGARLGRG